MIKSKTILSLLLIAVATPSAFSAVVHDVIAMTSPLGTYFGIGPNTGTPINYDYFNAAPIISRTGFVAFDATLRIGPGVTPTSDRGIWTTTNTGKPELIARSGTSDNGPGLGSGVVFSGVNNVGSRDMVINASGQLVFKAGLTGTGVDGSNNTSIFLSTGSQLTLIAREGPIGPSPNVENGVYFDSFDESTLDLGDNGQVVFGGGITSPNGDHGIWKNTSGVNTLIARTGTSGPGPNLGTGISFATFDSASINSSGKVLFVGRLTGNINGTNNRGIWITEGSSLVLQARSGVNNPGPNQGNNVFFGQIAESPDPLDLKNSGYASFESTLIGDNVNSVNNQGIWSLVNGTATTLAKSGINGPGPNLGTGIVFEELIGAPRSNESGKTTFLGFITGGDVTTGSNRGVFTCVDGSITALARSGNLALGPELGPDIFFNDFDRPVINNLGQVAFFANLIGQGVNDSNDTGLWISTDGILELIARKGDLFDVDPGVGVYNRIITGISFASGHSGKNGLDDFGRLTYLLTFDDGTQAIVVTQSSVPEPGCLILLIFVAPTLHWRRRSNL